MILKNDAGDHTFIIQHLQVKIKACIFIFIINSVSGRIPDQENDSKSLTQKEIKITK